MFRPKTQRILTLFALLTYITVPFDFVPSEKHQTDNVLTSFKIFSPIIMNLYHSPPPVSISHYISWGSTELTTQNFFNMGKTMGLSLSPGFNGVVILQFGEPWYEGSMYKVYDYAYGFVLIPIADVEILIKAYLSGFHLNSNANVYLIVVLGITNQGPYFSKFDDPIGFGQAWGYMISNLINWINVPPSYAGKLTVVGGVDNELSWNNAQKSINWKNGYLATSSQPYIYYGDCNSCPYYGEPDWSPEPWGWTLEQVYAMANTSNGFALPQIYRTDGQNADQWYYLSLYMYLQGSEPIGFWGSLTESSACAEKGGCATGTDDAIDNPPNEGWRQLWNNVVIDPRTASNLSGSPFEIPFSTDISWNHWKVNYP